MANRYVVASRRGALMRQAAQLTGPEWDIIKAGATPAGFDVAVSVDATLPAGTRVVVAEMVALADGKLRARLASPASCAGAWVSVAMLKVAAAAEDAEQWLLPSPKPPASSTAPRVFCFSASGTGPELFDGFRAAAKGVEVLPVLLPGRPPRQKEPVEGDLEALAKRLADALPFQECCAPYALLGVSIGALIAWALARELQRRGSRLPCVLCLLSEESPAHLEAHPAWTFTDEDSDAAVGEILRRSGFYDAVPAEFWESAGYMATFVPQRRAELKIEMRVAATRRAYADQPRLPLRVATYLGGKDRTKAAHMADWANEGGAFSFSEHPGGEHLFIADDAALHAEILADVRAEAAKALSREA